MKELNIFSLEHHFVFSKNKYRRSTCNERLRDQRITVFFLLFPLDLNPGPQDAFVTRFQVSGFQSFQNVSDVILVVTRRASILGDTSNASIR